MDGYMISVEQDAESIRVHGKTKPARIALAGAEHDHGDVVIIRTDIAGVTFRGANPFINGVLKITTTAGKAYQLHFRRKQQPGFKALAADLGVVAA